MIFFAIFWRLTKRHETTPDEALKAYKNKLTKLVNMIYMYETSYNMLFGEIRCHSVVKDMH